MKRTNSETLTIERGIVFSHTGHLNLFLSFEKTNRVVAAISTSRRAFDSTTEVLSDGDIQAPQLAPDSVLLITILVIPSLKEAPAFYASSRHSTAFYVRFFSTFCCQDSCDVWAVLWQVED